MSDLNKWIGVGRLTRDAEVMTTATGFAIMRFSLASSERVKNGDKWEDYSNFFDCKVLGKMAESLAKYLTKGKQVAIGGHLKHERWEKDGQKNSKIVIIVDDLQLLGGNDKPQSGESKSEPKKEEYTDDIPF